MEPDHVKEILNRVCRRKTFSSALPIYLNGKWRLAVAGLETAFYYNKLKLRNADADNPLRHVINTPHNDNEVDLQELLAYKEAMQEKHPSLHINWPQRIKNHCVYLTTERLRETEAYDLWLRTSAGQLRTFEDFLCFGEKVFGDCVEEPIETQGIKPPGAFISSYKVDSAYSESRNQNFDDGADKVGLQDYIKYTL